MNFLLKSGLLVAGLVSMTLSSPVALVERRNEPICTEIVIPVTISADNFIIPITNPPTYAKVQGTYNIAARFCEPQVKRHSRANTLQLLVHGATYTRNYWSGDGDPDQGYHGDEYSWIAFAGSQGYPTLSIDRICNGLSDHPDPISVCQPNVNIETIHQIIVKARSSQLPGPANRGFSKIIYVGHSLGSISGNLLHAKYPKDTDISILTGWSSAIQVSLLTNALASGTVPAALANPAKYGTLDPNYLVINSTADFRELLYAGAYDQALFNLDYSLRGTIAVGEGAATFAESVAVATSYVNPLLVLTAQYDAAFCPQNPSAAADCGTGWSSALQASQSVYPAARPFASYALPNAGHDWNFHYHAEDGFAIAHNWLESQGF